jgi:uncharacterized peroxidase-related enzyme
VVERTTGVATRGRKTEAHGEAQRYTSAVPRIELRLGAVGIRALIEFRPRTGKALLALAEALLRCDEGLTRGERELIAAFVSRGNGCEFCERSHAAVAFLELGTDHHHVEVAVADPTAAPLGPKLHALLELAEKVRSDGRLVTDDDVQRARAAGATDVEIHDTVLIAAAFCMYNRYVDALRPPLPADAPSYVARARQVARVGYLRS